MSSSFFSLQTRLAETQSSLEQNAACLPLLELRLSEQDLLRGEVEELRTRFDGLHQHQEEVDDPLDDEDVLNETREDAIAALVSQEDLSNSSSRPSPPLSDHDFDLPIFVRPNHHPMELNSSDRTLSPSRSPSRPRRAPVPSVFKSRPSPVRRVSSAGTLRPAGFLGLVREGEATIFDGVEDQKGRDMATIRVGLSTGGEGEGASSLSR